VAGIGPDTRVREEVKRSEEEKARKWMYDYTRPPTTILLGTCGLLLCALGDVLLFPPSFFFFFPFLFASPGFLNDTPMEI
jgi:hypothetical protein